MWIDHAVLGVVDLDRAAVQLFERYGLSSVVGGRHPAWGTENRIVPLGESYLELLAVHDPAAAERSPVGRSIARAIGDDDHFIGCHIYPACLAHMLCDDFAQFHHTG
jgi:hypothetical protein